MFQFIGPVHALVTAVEPKISEMAVNRHNNNIFHHHHQQQYSPSNFILTYSQYTNLAIFMLLFVLCAVEVIFVKIIAAININDAVTDRDLHSSPSNTGSARSGHIHDMDSLSSHQNFYLERYRQQRSVVAHLISTQSILQQMTTNTSSFIDSNNNNTISINNNSIIEAYWVAKEINEIEFPKRKSFWTEKKKKFVNK